MANQIYYIICISLFGLVFGSFLNCMAMRIVRCEDFVKGRSHCMSCNHVLGAGDMIPIVSFVLNRGRCRYCKEKISVRYPVTEAVFMFLSVVLYIAKGTDLISFYRDWILTGCIFVIALVDLESFEIPDGLLIAALINWFVFAALELYFGKNDFKHFGIQILTGLLLGLMMLVLSIAMDAVLKRDSLGGGDIKLFAVIGMYLGFAKAYELVLLSCIFGIAFALIRGAFKKGTSKEFPLGPSIAAATVTVLLFGDAITAWYFKLL